MPALLDNPCDAANLNAMFLAAWKRYGNAPALEEGDEISTFNILARRVMALSCFVDEIAADNRGAVIMFLPSGPRSVAGLLGIVATGRAAAPIDALPRERASESASKPASPLPLVFPDAESFPSAPSMILTLRPFERLLFQSIERTPYANLPVLYFDEIANRMDASHQETIRLRLEDPWLNEFSVVGADSPAIWIHAKREKSGAELVAPSNHDMLMRSIKAHIADLGEPRPSQFLSMTRLDQFSTWATGSLAGIALGATVHFIRRFYPAHVLTVLNEERIDHLLMTPRQYDELIPCIAAGKLSHRARFFCDPAPSDTIATAWLSAVDAPLESFSMTSSA